MSETAMVKVKTVALEGAALDWAVGKAGGHTVHVVEFGPIFRKGYLWPLVGNRKYNPSANWEIAGPIIEREKIGVVYRTNVRYAEWVGSYGEISPDWDWRFNRTGPTPLVAAMRCFVAFKLGDEVEVPDELVGSQGPLCSHRETA